MGSTLCSFLMAMVVLLISSPHSSSEPSGTTQELIDDICRKTADLNDCRKTFYDHLYNDVTEAIGLTQIALTQTLEYATETHIFLQRSQSNEQRPSIKHLYRICIAGYGVLMEEFENANLAFAKQDYSSMIFIVERSQRYETECQFVLGNKVPEVSARNLHSKVLIEMVLVSGKLIGKDSKV